ncbi:hypothetical protein CDCA_CDCA17G4304 [Cyanidium caldarium]|uniref:Uncharacterized protein n=1 Tax=Cyanidium caldarium TaxID=2771 RepID=A0AAV9J1T2_CYACA|nr:hypothetical protein CDCA_CDCA17G4304 [Cyanidium caldarium]
MSEKVPLATAPPADGDMWSALNEVPHTISTTGRRSGSAAADHLSVRSVHAAAPSPSPRHRKRTSAHRYAYGVYTALAAGTVLGLGVYAQVTVPNSLLTALAWNGLFSAVLGNGVAFIVLGGAALAVALLGMVVSRPHWLRLVQSSVALLIAVILTLLAALCLVYAVGNTAAERSAWYNASVQARCAVQSAHACAGYTGPRDGTAPATCTPRDTDRGGCRQAFFSQALNPYLAVQGMACLSVATLFILEMTLALVCI